MTEPAIYTFGYQGRAVSELQEEVTRLHAIVIDIRLRPRTWADGWAGPDLTRALGAAYRHIGELGNLNYHDHDLPIRIADAEAGLIMPSVLLRTGRSVILLCGCARPETCHRSVVADLLHERTGAIVEHLLPERFQLSLF